jgi:arabinose-5-phosphate isomerase
MTLSETMSAFTEPSDDELVAQGRAVLSEEANALAATRDRLGASFAAAARALLDCSGKVVVTGMGKSGAVGRKIAGTLSSTGTAAVFLHPAEGVHGDLGILTGDDVLLALSQSGETDELLAILPSVKRMGARIIAMTGALDSTLAQYAEAVLDTSVEKEACPLNLAPTTSTTCQIALGDALALCVMQARNFTKEDYALFHPGGSLGRRLLLRTADLMRTGDQLAIVSPDATVKDVLFAITKAKAGAAVMVDDGGRLLGIITDGDLRRYELERGTDAFADPAEKALNRHPTTTTPNTLAAEVLSTINEKALSLGVVIGEVPVLDEERRPVGILMVKDLARAGILV